jgi:hypothetical protein
VRDARREISYIAFCYYPSSRRGGKQKCTHAAAEHQRQEKGQVRCARGIIIKALDRSGTREFSFPRDFFRSASTSGRFDANKPSPFLHEKNTRKRTGVSNLFVYFPRLCARENFSSSKSAFGGRISAADAKFSFPPVGEWIYAETAHNESRSAPQHNQ